MSQEFIVLGPTNAALPVSSIGGTSTTHTYGTFILGSATGDSTGEVGLKALVIGGSLVLGAGTSIIGNVAIDQTTQGTTNGVVNKSGENHIGSVGFDGVLVSSAVVFTDTNARATGDYCGTDTVPQSFANAVRVSGGTGKIRSIYITDYTTTAAVALELWLFSATFTVPADNAAWDITDAAAITCIGVIPIVTTKWYASSSNKVYSDDTLNVVIKPAATSLFYAIVARGTTPAWTTAAGLKISLGIEQN